jgi:hypothetical protein
LILLIFIFLKQNFDFRKAVSKQGLLENIHLAFLALNLICVLLSKCLTLERRLRENPTFWQTCANQKSMCKKFAVHGRFPRKNPAFLARTYSVHASSKATFKRFCTKQKKGKTIVVKTAKKIFEAGLTQTKIDYLAFWPYMVRFEEDN